MTAKLEIEKSLFFKQTLISKIERICMEVQILRKVVRYSFQKGYLFIPIYSNKIVIFYCIR